MVEHASIRTYTLKESYVRRYLVHGRIELLGEEWSSIQGPEPVL